MNLHHLLFFCFFSALCCRDNGLVSAKLNIYAGPEGGTGTITCYPSVSANKKFFCKGECKPENILIKTEDVRAQNGRFSLKYRTESGKRYLSTTITNLTLSDSGLYRSGLGTNLVPESYCDFVIKVSNDSLLYGHSGFSRTDIEGENITFGCSNTVHGDQKFLCKDKCKTEEDVIIATDGNRAQSGRYSIEYIEGSTFGLHVTITNVSKSDTRWYKCGYGSPSSSDSYNTYLVLVTSLDVFTDPTTSEPTTTPLPLSTSVPSTSTATTQSSVTSFSFAENDHRPPAADCSGLPHPAYFSAVAVLLLVVFVLSVCVWRLRRSSRHHELPVSYKTLASTCDGSTQKNSSY